ncbi:MAG TPA: MoaD/ThiS family protein [Actinocrinis sp.]|jgi:molybdopterin converting factor small subunit|uniref:MoaD/ThiS family protein n=1 Tax=Actinocrinis sp. TaxID=1920516 RepID=UPI002DDCFD10|nr:MoaD/ThiS family protein [Actinocrinis sp.]HEV3171656.1 MoaD/ThiS family protein [Actinocrinis sp.]
MSDTGLSGTAPSRTALSGKAARQGESPATGERGVATLRYWAAAREAAGTAEEETRATTLGRALTEAVATRGQAGERLAVVLRRSSFLVDGAPVGKRDPETVEIRSGAVVEVLPPFAGG